MKSNPYLLINLKTFKLKRVNKKEAINGSSLDA